MKTTVTVGGMILAVGLLLLAAVPSATANNISVTNVALVNQNRGAKTVEVKFDLKWDNSWRTVPNTSYPAYTNWDAAWVFVKFQAPGSNIWEHALLAPQGHTPANGSTIDVGTNGANGVGVFVYNSGLYTGGVNYAGTRLLWNYGSNGYNFAAGASVAVSVQAIEMVYVPQGPFWLGNTNAILSGTSFHAQGNTNSPVYVADNSPFELYWGVNDTTHGTISSSFPKGYNAFYCMKYETSQGQYCDFLNKLTTAQATNRPAGFSTNSLGVYTNSAANTACGNLNWGMDCAYAAWAGLRPMTELEFEKACRGPAMPVNGEYPWGDATTLTNITGVIGTAGSGTETPNPATANCDYNGGIGGPVRVGIFATATSSRPQSGASYWGIMELGGNLNDRCVTVGTAHGLAFAGSLGSGVLNASGNATNTDWWVDGSGAGCRGGSYRFGSTYMRTSDRASTGADSDGLFGYTGRFVRMAP